MAMKNEKNICDILRFEGIMSGGFGMAPRIVMRDTRLSIEAKAIYCYFQSFAGSADKAFPKRETILNELNISKSRYYKYLQELIDYDYVRIEREKNDNNWKGRNIYVIVANPQSEDVEPKSGKQKKEESADSVDKKNIVTGSVPQKRKKTVTDSLYRDLHVSALIKKYPEDKSRIMNIYNIIKDMESSEEVKVGGAIKKKRAIKEIIDQITDKHIVAVLKTIQDNKEDIRNMKAWIQTCLLNSIYDDAIDQKVCQYEARQRADEAKAAKVNAEKIEIVKEEKRKHIPFLSEKEREINSLYAQMAREKILSNGEGEELLRKKVSALEEEMKKFIIDNDIDPSLYAFM